ncbi:hypothetical protein C8Q74DRAFT_134770 [Fomes fomentarius]|nr:hypothetical protein C8Q74DRAFT_134770 [Fomes fomentarius]
MTMRICVIISLGATFVSRTICNLRARKTELPCAGIIYVTAAMFAYQKRRSRRSKDQFDLQCMSILHRSTQAARALVPERVGAIRKRTEKLCELRPHCTTMMQMHGSRSTMGDYQLNLLSKLVSRTLALASVQGEFIRYGTSRMCE